MRKSIYKRKLKDLRDRVPFATTKAPAGEKLPHLVYRHHSMIRRRLGNVDAQLQENKATNLKLAYPHVNGILIRPGEVFSFWKLVGECSAKKGYKEGLIVGRAVKTRSGVGGGMCQFTNLIHWMVLHSPLEIIEHHHHDRIDMFPDYGRKVPFGTGTSIVYNYLDYRFRNNTNNTFQLIVYTDDENLCGELRAQKPLDIKIHIKTEDEFFSREDGVVYRNGKVYARVIDKKTGNQIDRYLLRTNHAKVLYDTSGLEIVDMDNPDAAPKSQTPLKKGTVLPLPEENDPAESA